VSAIVSAIDAAIDAAPPPLRERVLALVRRQAAQVLDKNGEFYGSQLERLPPVALRFWGAVHHAVEMARVAISPLQMRAESMVSARSISGALLGHGIWVPFHSVPFSGSASVRAQLAIETVDLAAELCREAEASESAVRSLASARTDIETLAPDYFTECRRHEALRRLRPPGLRVPYDGEEP